MTDYSGVISDFFSLSHPLDPTVRQHGTQQHTEPIVQGRGRPPFPNFDGRKIIKENHAQDRNLFSKIFFSTHTHNKTHGRKKNENSTIRLGLATKKTSALDVDLTMIAHKPEESNPPSTSWFFFLAPPAAGSRLKTLSTESTKSTTAQYKLNGAAGPFRW